MSVKTFGVCDVCGRIMGECDKRTSWSFDDNRVDEDYVDKLISHDNDPSFDLDSRDKLSELIDDDKEYLDQDICSLKCLLFGLDFKQSVIIAQILANLYPEWNTDITLEFDTFGAYNSDPYEWIDAIAEKSQDEWERILGFDAFIKYYDEDPDGLHLEDN